jgi:DNA-binding transcriptional LysR family regulator
MDRLAAINVFVQVAQTRSFADAGRILGVSASAVGKSVVRLEQQLGVRLFHRSTRSVTLTPEGMLFLERAKRIVEDFEQASVEVRQNAVSPRGLLRVSLPMVGAVFAPLVSAFQQRHPEVELDLELTNRPVDVINEGFDLVIRTGQLADTRLMTKHLVSFRMLVVAAPAYLREHGEPAEPRDLADHRLIRMRMPQTGRFQPWIFDAASDVVDGVRPIIVCNDLATILSLSSAGHGIAYVPDFSAAADVANGALASLMKERVAGEEAFQALWPSGRLVTPKVRAFVDFAGMHLKAALQRRS